MVTLFDDEFDLNLLVTQSLGPFDFAQMPAIVASVVRSDSLKATKRCKELAVTEAHKVAARHC